MNYTKSVREYCKNNSGAIFDVSKLKDTFLQRLPANPAALLERRNYDRIHHTPVQHFPMIRCGHAVSRTAHTSATEQIRTVNAGRPKSV